MSTKYTYDNYTITVDFKNDLHLAMTASDVFSGDIFINENIELTKIKKDTIIAALTRKNEKNLMCKFNLVDVQPKKLIISFEVSYDFLPTFTQFISLDQIQKQGTGLNKVESAELRSDIDQLQKLLQNISCGQANIALENSGNGTFNAKGDITTIELKKGTYMFEMSGHFVHSAGTFTKHDLVFTLAAQGQKYQMEVCMHTNGGYGYPYAIRKELIMNQNGAVSITVEHKQSGQFTIQNNVISFSPMIRLN